MSDILDGYRQQINEILRSSPAVSGSDTGAPTEVGTQTQILDSYRKQINPDYQPKHDVPVWPGAPDELTMKRQAYDYLNRYIASTPDPQATMAKVNASMYMAKVLNVPAGAVFQNFDVISKQYWGEDKIPTNAWKAAQMEFGATSDFIQASKVGWDLMFSGYDAKRWQQFQDLVNKIPDTSQIQTTFGGRILRALARFAPSAMDAVSSGWQTGLTGAGAGALMGAAVEGVGAVPGLLGGYAVGQATGTLKEIGVQEVGGIFTQIMTSKEPTSGKYVWQMAKDHREVINVARAFSLAGGIPATALEMLQLNKLAGGLMLRNVVRDAAKQQAVGTLVSGAIQRQAMQFITQHVLNVGEQVIQENLQSLLEQASQDLATAVVNRTQGTNIPTSSVDQYLQLVKQTTTDTALAMGIMGVPGTLSEIKGRAAERAAREKAPATGPEVRAAKNAVDEAMQAHQAASQAFAENPGANREQFMNSLAALNDAQGKLDQLTGQGAGAAGKATGQTPGLETADLQQLNSLVDTLEKKFEADPAANAAAYMQALRDQAAAQEQAAAEAQAQAPAAEQTVAPPWEMTREEWKNFVGTSHQSPEVAGGGNIPDHLRSLIDPNLRDVISRTSPQMSDGEVDGVALLMGLRAHRMGLAPEQWTQEYLAPGIVAPGGGDPTILEGHPAAVQFLDDGKALFHMSETANFRSWAEEAVHIFRRQLPEADLALAEKWAGVKDGVWDRDSEERLGSAGLQYLREGTAPTPELEGFFRQFADWLSRVYDAVKNRWKLTADIRSVFDNLFSDPRSPLSATAESRSTENVLFQTEDFGPAFAEYSGKPEGAIAKLLSEKTGEVPAAIEKAGLGPVDFVYGQEGDPEKNYQGGYGLAHIVAKHGVDVAKQVPGIIRAGSIDRSSRDRVYITAKGRRAVVRLDWNGNKKTWLVTAFDKKESTRSAGTSDLGGQGGEPAVQQPRQPGAQLPSPREGLKQSIDPEDGKVNPDVLFQSPSRHEESVHQAVEQGLPVPDEVLAEYKGQEWAKEETQARQSIKQDARGFEDSGEFTDWAMQSDVSGTHSAEYFDYLWHRAQETQAPLAVRNRRFVESMTPDALESLLAIAGQDPEKLQKMNKLLRKAAEEIAGRRVENKNAAISHAGFERLMALIRKSPAYYRELLTSGLEEEDATQQRQREIELDSETDLTQEQRREEAAAAKTPEAKASTLDQVRQRLQLSADRDRLLKRAIASTDKEHAAELRNQQRSLQKEFRSEKTIMRKAQSKIRSILRPPSGAIDYNYAMRIVSVQETVITKATQREIKAWRALQQYAREHNHQGLSEDVRAELSKQYVQAMTLDELDQLKNVVQHLRDQGRAARDSVERYERGLVNEASRNIAKNINGGEPQMETRGLGSRQTKKTQTAGPGGKVAVETLRPNRLAVMVDGGKKGPVYDWLVNKVNAATDSELRETDSTMEAGQAKMRELGITASQLGKLVTIDNYTYTTDEILSMYIYRKNEDSAEALAYGNKVDYLLMTKFIDKLTPEQLAWGDYMMETFGQANFDRLQKIFINVYNRGMKKVDAYFPMKRLNVNYDNLNAEVAADLLSRSGIRHGYVQKGFTKRRIKIRPEYQIPIRLGATSMWMDQVTKHEKFVSSAQLVKRLHRIFGDRAVKDAITAKFGREFNDAIEKYINDFANPNIYRSFDGASNASRMLRQHAAVGYLAFNLVTMMKQAPSLALFLADTGPAGPAYMASAAWQLMSNWKETVDLVYRLDPQMKHRSYSRFTEELKLADKNAYEKVVKKVGGAGMMPLMAVDKVVTLIGWKAVYDRNLRLGNSQQEAARAAQESVLRTQPAARAKDVAQIYRSAEGLNWFLMFTNQLNQIWNMMYFDIPTAFKNGDMVYALATATGIVVSALAMGMIQRKRLPKDAKEVGLDTLNQVMSAVPFVGRNFMTGLQGWFSTGVDPVPVVSEMGRAAWALTNPDKDSEEKMAALLRVLPKLMITAGLPTTEPQRIVKAISRQDAWELLGGKPEE